MSAGPPDAGLPRAESPAADSTAADSTAADVSAADVTAADVTAEKHPPAGPLVVSLVPRSFEALGRALEGGACSGADVVELRLDHLATEVERDPAGLRSLMERAGRPVIAAVHGAEGFGAFAGEVGERRELLRAAASAGASFVDVDERFAREVGELGAARIISTHRAARTGSELDALAAGLDALSEPGRDLVKVAPAAATAAEGVELLHWLGEREPGTTVAVSTGAPGSFTRLLAPAFGGALTFAAPSQVPGADLALAAPGQLSVDHVRAVWPGSPPSTGTGVALVCGDPISHSAGPVVHGAALAATGVDGVLAPTLASPEEVLGLGARLVGLSVTAPYKVEAMGIVGEASSAARAIGALNTIEVGAGGAERGSNTDAPAIRAALEASGVELQGAAALVVGAGGAARAAVHALREAGARVTVAARRVEAAAALSGDRAVSLEALSDLDGEAPRVIVHATPLGAAGSGSDPASAENPGVADRGEAPIPSALLTPGVTVLDAVYRPRRTGLLRLAASRGAVTVEGAEWFLQQAWLQHLRLFRHGYAARYGTAGPPAEVVTAAAAAMGRALDAWLEGDAR